MDPVQKERSTKPAAQAGEEQIEHLTPQETEQIQTAGAVPGTPGPEPGVMKIDLHCHSEASPDCRTPLAMIPARCRERGIRVQAITDHNLIWGAQKLQELVAADPTSSLTVIVGEEISSTEGEIIGLFLKEAIPGGLTPEEAVARIEAQGGLVLIPHGFDPIKRWRLQPSALDRITASVDIIETFNARISRPRWNQAAVDWAMKRQVLMSAGSDAHTLAYIGDAWVETPYRRIASPQDLIAALSGGKPTGVWTHPALAFSYKMLDRLRRRLIR